MPLVWEREIEGEFVCELRLRLNGVIGVDRSSRVSVRECSDRGIAKRLSSCVWCALGWDERRYGKTTTLPQRY